MSFTRKRKNILRELPINPYVDVEIDGTLWEPLGLVPGGWELILKKGKPTDRRFLLLDEFEELQRSERVKIFDNISSFSARTNISSADRDTTVLRFFWVCAVDDARHEGHIRAEPKGKDFQRVIELKATGVAESFYAYRQSGDFDHGRAKRKAHGGSLSQKRKPDPQDIDPEKLVFDAKTLKRHYRTWVEASGDMWKLRPGQRSHALGGPKPSAETLRYIKEHITNAETEIASNASGLLEYVNAWIENDNALRGSDNQIPLATYYSIAQAIEEIPADRLIGGRRGKKQAVQMLRHVGDGPVYTRPGEMVRRAREFFKMMDVEWTEDRLNELERELRTYVVYDRDPQGPEAALMGDGRALGTVHTRTTPTVPAPDSQKSLPPPSNDAEAKSDNGDLREDASRPTSPSTSSPDKGNGSEIAPDSATSGQPKATAPLPNPFQPSTRRQRRSI
jgi:hypothetical protein